MKKVNLLLCGSLLILPLVSQADAPPVNQQVKKGAKTMTAEKNKPYEITKGLTALDQVIGDGAEAKSGMRVKVNYTGKLTNGTQFDSSVGRAPFVFNLGAGEVIQGWDKGVAGMKVHGKRQLTIAPELAYGSRAIGTIPANSTLIFDVELLGIEQ